MRIFSILSLVLTFFMLFPAGVAKSVTSDGAVIDSDAVVGRDTINVGTCLISPPYEFVGDKGEYAGITADYVRLIKGKLDGPFKRIRCTDEERMFKAVTLKDVDIIPLVERTPELLETMDFVFPYIQQPTVIVTRDGVDFGGSIESLRGRTVALLAYAGVRHYLDKLLGDQVNMLLISGTPTSVLDAVMIGDADAAILDLAVATHYLERSRFKTMKIAGFTDYVAVKGLAVRKGLPELRSKLLNAFASISPEDHAELRERWLTRKTVPVWKDDRLIAWTLIILGIGLGAVTLVLGWNMSLQSTVRKRTSTLEAVNNMLMDSLACSTEQETCEICLEQIRKAMRARVAFLAVKRGDDLELRAVTPDVPADPMFICIGEKDFPELDTAHQIDLSECGEQCENMPHHLVLRAFKNSDSEVFVAGVAKDEEVSDESLVVFDNLVPTFEQVLRKKQVELSLLEKDKQILRAQRMESLGTMAGGIAHDFNNILGAIIANGEMIEMFHEVEDEGVRNKVDSILTAAYRGRDVVRQVLDFARPNSESVKPLRLDELIIETERMLRASLPQTLDIKLDLEEDVVIMANPTQVSQVIMNLCMNSAQAMSEQGGSIQMSLKTGYQVPTDMVRDLDIDAKDAALMQVSDDGPGMLPEVLERIFDPFFTTKPPGEGTGLGLAVVSGIVSSYGGAIKVDSTEGRGTTISIVFPLTDVVPFDESSDSLGDGDHGVGRILFVDDEEELLNSYTEVLQKFGYVVKSMNSADAALDLFRQAPGAYSLVLTDYNMPGMAGDEFARKIMEIRPDLPVILCTGYSSRFDERKAEGLGLAALLKKPVSIRELTEAVGQYIAPINGNKV